MVQKEGNRKWYVVYTRPRAEKKVNEQFKELGFETFCPTRKTLRIWSDRKKYIDQVLFTSYVFVRCTKSDFPAFYDVFGFVRVVYYLGKPALIRDQEIHNIKVFLEQTTDCQIRFEISERVEIADGPLKGKTGIIERIGKNKLRIRIEQLGINMLAEVHRNKVKTLSA